MLQFTEHWAFRFFYYFFYCVEERRSFDRTTLLKFDFTLNSFPRRYRRGVASKTGFVQRTRWLQTTPERTRSTTRTAARARRWTTDVLISLFHCTETYVHIHIYIYYLINPLKGGGGEGVRERERERD